MQIAHHQNRTFVNYTARTNLHINSSSKTGNVQTFHNKTHHHEEFLLRFEKIACEMMLSTYIPWRARKTLHKCQI